MKSISRKLRDSESAQPLLGGEAYNYREEETVENWKENV